MFSTYSLHLGILNSYSSIWASRVMIFFTVSTVVYTIPMIYIVSMLNMLPVVTVLFCWLW